MSLKLEMTRIFKAPREKVFAAFTEAEMIQQWFGPGPMAVSTATMEKKVGGSYRIEIKDPGAETHTVAGVIKEFNPHDRLSYTWKWQSPDAVETLVSFDFRDKGDETEVYLLHERFQTEEAVKLHGQGWTGCLEKFDKFIQK